MQRCSHAAAENTVHATVSLPRAAPQASAAHAVVIFLVRLSVCHDKYLDDILTVSSSTSHAFCDISQTISLLTITYGLE